MSELYRDREPTDTYAPADYYLDDAEFTKLQNALVASTQDQSGQEGIHAVWIAQNHPYANVVRTLEAKQFPEIPEIMEPFEDQSVFLALTDTRPEQRRVVHAFRLSSIFLAGRTELPGGDTLGIAFIDDIVASGQGVDIEAFKTYYASEGIDLTKCVSVETNFRVGMKKVEVESGLRVSDLGYIAVFQALEKLGLDKEDAVVFAHLNQPAIGSLGALGISYAPVMGRDDLKTPTVGENPFDEKYRPVVIPTSAANVAIFKQLLPFAAPEVNFS